MSQRLSFAAAFAAVCAFALALALGSNAYSRANARTAAPKAPALAVAKFRVAAEKAEKAGYLKRLGGGKVDAKGWISLTHFDALAGKAAPADHYVLNTDEGTYPLKVGKGTKVRGSGAQTSLVEGQVVQMTGAISGNTITVAQAQVTSTLPDPRLGPVPTTTQRTQRVLTILATYEDDILAGEPTARQPWTQGAVQSAMGSTGDGLGNRTVRNFFRQSSEGSYTLDATVTPWLKVSMRRGAACVEASDWEPWFDAAKEAAKTQANLDPADYDYVLLVTTRGATDCSFGGTAFGWGRTIVFPYEPWENDPNFPRDRVMHELGHAVGLGHAGVANCREGATRAPISGDCDLAQALDQDLEYGDTFNVMGTSKVKGTTRDVRLLSAAHRVQVGFIPLDRVIDAQPSDVLEHTIVRTKPDLDSNTAPEAGKQLIEVRRSKTSQGTNIQTNGLDAWEIEYRGSTQPFDNFPAGSPAVDRVTLRLSNPVRATSGWNKTYSVSSAVTQRGAPIDANDPYTAGLVEGQSLYDPVEDFTITVTDITETEAKIKVTPGGPQDELATQVSQSGSTLSVHAASGKRDSISVALEEERYVVRNFGGPVEPSGSCEHETPTTAACSSRNVRLIQVFAYDQDDVVSISPSVSVATRLHGSTGNDFLDGGSGADLFTSLSTVDGNDGLSGNSGRDTVSYATRTAGVVVTDVRGGNTTAEERDELTSVENADGSPHADFLSLASEVPHRIDGGGGADTIVTSAEDDRIIARDGVQDASINCGGGADALIADGNDPAMYCPPPVLAPQPEITDGPADGATISEPQPLYTFAVPYPGTATSQCAVTPVGTLPNYGTCTSATTHKPVAALTAGSYEVWVRVRDTAGTVLGDPVKRTFTLDLSAPETAISTKPASPNALSSQAFTFTNSGAATLYECKVDTGGWVTCQSSRTYTHLPDGERTIQVRAIGPGGAVDPEPASYTWTIDTTAPETTLGGTPANNGSAVMGSVNWTVSSNEAPATYKCGWDGAPMTNCTTNWANPATVGTHTLKIAAVDALGNVDPTPAERTVTITAQSFDTVIGAGDYNQRFSNAKKPTFTFSGTPTGSYAFKCQTGANADWVDCTSPYTPTFTSAGWVSFKVAAVNSQGERDFVPAARAFWVDLTPPNSAFAPGGPTEGSTQQATGLTTTATFNFDAPGELSPSACGDEEPANCATYECKLDNAAGWTPCATPYTTPALYAGAHKLELRAVDAAGNPDPTPSVRNWTVAVPQILSIESSAGAPSTVPLSAGDGFGVPLDWIKWSSGNSASFARKDATQKISTWSSVQPGGTTGPLALPNSFTWTDAVGGTPSGSSTNGVSRALVDGRGFAFTVPVVNTEDRTLRVYAGVRGAATTGRLSVSINGGTPATTDIAVASSTALSSRAFTVRLRPSTATATVRVEWTLLSGGAQAGAAISLHAASLH